MMQNTLTLTPIMGDDNQVTYMTGHLDTKHGMYEVSVSNFKSVGKVLVNLNYLYKKNTVYVQPFESIGEAMNAMMTMKFEDERFLKVTY